MRNQLGFGRSLAGTLRGIGPFIVAKVRRRIEEAEGVFDYFAVDTENTERERQGIAPEEYADFVGPIWDVEIAGKGRGVVASQNIPKGKLLLCDRALVVADTSTGPQTFAKNERKNQIKPESQIRAASELVHRMKDDEEFARRVYNLYAGDDEKPPLEGEGKVPVDHFFVQSAVEYNAYEPQPLPRVSDPAVGSRRGEKRGMTGL
mmetsp:Transcript_22495/g.59773  ORF Transcript_22495/g.59773 Transcript_22495/m.59773 type:complete len:205 (-) Transcript_22495:777-1391(-)